MNCTYFFHIDSLTIKINKTRFENKIRILNIFCLLFTYHVDFLPARSHDDRENGWVRISVVYVRSYSYLDFKWSLKYLSKIRNQKNNHLRLCQVN